jgi:hypothetical protein
MYLTSPYLFREDLESSLSVLNFLTVCRDRYIVLFVSEGLKTSVRLKNFIRNNGDRHETKTEFLL